MLILSNTTDKIQIFLESTVSTSQLSCLSVYRDTTSSSITPSRNVTNTNNITAVDLVGSPPSSTKRVVDYISIFNNDDSSSDVNLEFSDNGTNYTLFKCRLASKERLEYQESSGFKVLTNNSSQKVNTKVDIPTDTVMNSFVLREDVTNTVTTSNAYVSVPQLGFPVQENKKYWFRFLIVYTANATTTGSRWFLEGPSSSGYLSFQVFTSLTTTTQTLGMGANEWQYILTSNASSSSTAGNTTTIEGFAYPDTDGRISLRFATEISGGTITLKKGSVIYFRQLL